LNALKFISLSVLADDRNRR